MSSEFIKSLQFPINDTQDEPLVHISVIFLNKAAPNEILKIAEEANTPMWLTKKLYTKI
jgi:hypothetical protein